ncbi:AAA family ATPase [Aliivibrio fischeri]|uniref:AAA family ATPase n=1 Tax=Aliivibrio fischeri TaxID=668 RepID=UPI001EEEBFCD|nr:AAA family ATPase [Aliivibrio fischeri]
MARDNTKYRFEENVYGKGRLVHAVVATYIERYDATLAQLEQIFPGSLQNKNGNVFITQQEYDERLSKSSDVENRFYNKTEDRLLTHDGITIYVSNQWGVGNVEGFYQQAIKQGFTIEKIISSSQATLEPFFTASNENTISPLNQILYGPPGTGKTYHTIEAAVKAAEPTFTWATRDELKAEYVRLIADKRIRFVTFHQSYGYEEFVEGVKAETVDGKINYKIESGVFKKTVENSRAKRVSQLDLSSHYDLSKRKIWKMSLGNTQTDEGEMVFNECIENNYLLLGYGGNINFEGCDSTLKIKEKFIDAGYQLKPQDYNVTSVNTLVNKMSVGDIVIISDGNHKFKAIAEIISNYSFIDDDRDWYFQKRDVKWLMIFDEGRPVDELFSSSLSQMTLYNLKDSVISRDKLSRLLNESKQELEEIKNYVLIIDEINRGNISKIFGELITLIEPSKRKGAEEEIELVLPYSGDTFSVPDNLHIIGTMNTADRSLAMMDTALRRRFDFIEMMPNPKLFNNKQIKGIDLTRLLNALNKRIEALYDREHTLGHAFLFPAYNEQNEDKAFELLKAAFKNKIIPLLEEYFYDDWNKIRLVLGDNQKSDELRFVEEHNESYDSLFGSNHGLETYEESKTCYTLMSFDGENSVWDNPQAYIAVYTSIK